MNWIINGYHKSRHSIVMTIAIMLVFRDKSRQFLSLFIHFVIWLQITDYSALRGMLTKEGNLLQCFLWRRSWNILVNLANGIVNKIGYLVEWYLQQEVKLWLQTVRTISGRPRQVGREWTFLTKATPPYWQRVSLICIM